ncbi:hypothetical protein FHX64_000814 [Microbacter margulisiae]|uniref:Uncharacterized protein n=1 Tax=Microbacter margulisiae TaxID=1350067 RepID=A0A7W5H1R4_9PORP|nr:hypothetical protein [Microbacter margulisiae]
MSPFNVQRYHIPAENRKKGEVFNLTGKVRYVNSFVSFSFAFTLTPYLYTK